MASDMRVAILGSGWWHRTRGGPAHVVSFGDTNVMFDCGRKAVSRLFRVGIPPAEVSALFISHSHFDHNMSLVEFLFGSWLTGRTEPVPRLRSDGHGRAHRVARRPGRLLCP